MRTRGTYKRGEVRDVLDPLRGCVHAVKVASETNTATTVQESARGGIGEGEGRDVLLAAYHASDMLYVVNDSLKVGLFLVRRHVFRNKIDLRQKAYRCDAMS